MTTVTWPDRGREAGHRLYTLYVEKIQHSESIPCSFLSVEELENTHAALKWDPFLEEQEFMGFVVQ